MGPKVSTVSPEHSAKLMGSPFGEAVALRMLDLFEENAGQLAEIVADAMVRTGTEPGGDRTLVVTIFVPSLFDGEYDCDCCHRDVRTLPGHVFEPIMQNNLPLVVNVCGRVVVKILLCEDCWLDIMSGKTGPADDDKTSAING